MEQNFSKAKQNRGAVAGYRLHEVSAFTQKQNKEYDKN